MSTLLIISSLVHFSVLSPATYHACACAPHPHPSSYSLSSRSLCIMLLCDRWGAAARHPVLGTAGHRGEGKARRLTEIRPLIRRCDEVLRVCVCGGGDRQTSGAPKPTAIRHICYQRSARCSWNSDALRSTSPVNVIHCPPARTAALPPHPSV